MIRKQEGYKTEEWKCGLRNCRASFGGSSFLPGHGTSTTKKVYQNPEHWLLLGKWCEGLPEQLLYVERSVAFPMVTFGGATIISSMTFFIPSTDFGNKVVSGFSSGTPYIFSISFDLNLTRADRPVISKSPSHQTRRQSHPSCDGSSLCQPSGSIRRPL